MPVTPPINADEDAARLRLAFLIAALFTAVLWTIKLSELALGMDLSRYSIYPGDPATLTGTLFAPLLHESLRHLFANTATLGLALAILLRRLDPPAPEKIYRWEQEGGEEDDWPFDERPGKEHAGTGNDRPPPAPDASRAKSDSAPPRT
jgi:hypothetical protein